MVKVKILGTELEADLFNTDFGESYKKSVNWAAEIAKEAEKQCICIQCDAIKKCIDEVLGTGSSEKILGENADLQMCFEAFKDLCSVYAGYVNETVEEEKER